MDSSITLNGSRDKSMMDLDSPRGRPGYSRPSYTHRPSQIGLNNVVQLSKESLQAIEQAGQECGSGKRGGPRLNYEELDPKRRRFLERNRQAAARCRERKKQWIVSLEARANVRQRSKRLGSYCAILHFLFNSHAGGVRYCLR